MNWEAGEGGVFELWHDGHLLFRYRATTPASKPHADVVALPSDAGEAAGTNLVLCCPHDHVWHFGLFFVPKLVDGINCWESELFRREGRVHGYAVSAGAAVEGGVGAPAAGTGPDAGRHTAPLEASLVDRLVWRSSEGEELLHERRRLTVQEPRDGAYLITWETELEAVGQSRHLSSESRHGHYSGLSVRFIRSMTGGRILLPGSENPPMDSGPPGPWCDYSGYLDGSLVLGRPHMAGIALFDHPDNPYPSRFFTMNQPFGFIAANPTYYQVITLQPGRPVTFRWGIWVHAGWPEAAALESAFRAWVAS